jgi:hypothetical protein
MTGTPGNDTPLRKMHPPRLLTRPGTYREQGAARPRTRQHAERHPAARKIPLIQFACVGIANVLAGHGNEEQRHLPWGLGREKSRKSGKEHAGNSFEAIPESAIYGYNLDDVKSPPGDHGATAMGIPTPAPDPQVSAGPAEPVRSRSSAAPPPWPCKTQSPRCADRSASRRPSCRPGFSSAGTTGTSSRAAWRSATAGTAARTSSSQTSASRVTAGWPTCSPRLPAPRPRSPQ